MRADETFDIFGTGDFDIFTCLVNIKAVEIFKEAKIVKRWIIFKRKFQFGTNDIIDSFGGVFMTARDGKVVDLLEKEDFFTAKDSAIDAPIMCCSGEVKLG